LVAFLLTRCYSNYTTRLSDEKVWFFYFSFQERRLSMKIALCTELRNVEWFESRLRSLFEGDGQLVIDELWNEKQLSQALRRSRYHAVVIAMTGARGLEAAIQAKQLAPEVPLVWWSDDENFALIAYQLHIPAFLSIDCSDQELYEAIKPITKWRYEHANCAMQL
jgi:DNA-binding NarL/FixJ family response regulator